jgi:hypothetical protein
MLPHQHQFIKPLETKDVPRIRRRLCCNDAQTMEEGEKKNTKKENTNGNATDQQLEMTES